MNICVLNTLPWRLNLIKNQEYFDKKKCFEIHFFM